MLSAVGDAAARGGLFIEDSDGEIRNAAQELSGKNGAAEPSSYDNNVELEFGQMSTLPGIWA